MAKKPTNALGRGLSDLSGMGQDALFGQPEVKSAASAGSVHLPISQVEPGLNQPRKRFEPEALADLADSIRTHGIIQPITVRKLSSGYYQSSPVNAAGGPPKPRVWKKYPPSLLRRTTARSWSWV